MRVVQAGVRGSVAVLALLTLGPCGLPGAGAGPLDVRVLAPVDPEAELARDRDRGPLVPYRVAVPVPFELSIADAGTWEALPGGAAVWRLRIESPGARFLSFKFSDLVLPEGATLRVRSASDPVVAGPFPAPPGRPTRRFGSPPVPGDAAVLELYVRSRDVETHLTLESVSHGFRGFPGEHTTAGGPFACQRDVNCPEGAGWQDEKRAVAEGYDGSFVCSGTLVDNVRRDNRLLYLTAEHCEFWRDPATLAFYWNYENSGCGTNDAPWQFSTGATERYRSTATDVDLLELHGAGLAAAYDVHFAGWSRTAATPASGATIGFPDDKPKQLSIEHDPLVDCAAGGCPGGFGPAFWRVTGWDVGVTEGGSSGGALWNEDRRIVGTLTGGVGTNCNDFAWDEFSKLAASWSGLAPFLDPDATGTVFLDGRDHDGTATAPPPAGDGIDGMAMFLGKGPGDTLVATYDAASCRDERAVLLWGWLGDWDGYVADVGPGCDLGDGGTGSFSFAGTGVWFNLVWVGPDGVAGHAGYGSTGARAWSAAGLCGATADDPSTETCVGR